MIYQAITTGTPSYSQVKRKNPIDWNKTLDKAIKLENDGDVESLSYLDANMRSQSSDWVTCACGSQCNVINRYFDGAPVDPGLRDLGSVFYNMICRSNYSGAKETLEKIELRSSLLIKEYYSLKGNE